MNPDDDLEFDRACRASLNEDARITAARLPSRVRIVTRRWPLVVMPAIVLRGPR